MVNDHTIWDETHDRFPRVIFRGNYIEITNVFLFFLSYFNLISNILIVLISY